jgi:cytochrome bd-type quinol oxidase subunit 2
MESIRKVTGDTYFIQATKFIIWVNIFFSILITLLGLFLIFTDTNKDNNNNNRSKIETIRIGAFITILGVIFGIINYYVFLEYVNNDIVKVLVWLSVFSYFLTPYRIRDTVDNNRRNGGRTGRRNGRRNGINNN